MAKNTAPRPMHALIDAHMLGQREGGNETYIAGLLSGLVQLGDDDLALTALYNPTFSSPATARVHAVRLSSGGNVGRLFREIPRLCHSLRADVAHLTYNAPPHIGCGLVLSVHDVIFRLYPRYFTPRVRLLLSTLLPLSMRRADAIVTLSEASRRDIERFYPFTRGKISVTPLAAGPVASVEPDHDGAEAVVGSAQFILAVSTVQPRKNMRRLIEAYIKGREHRRFDSKLVIVGRAAWRHSEVYRIAQQSLFRDDIVFAGYLEEPVIAALYRRCAVFVYPSLYEGFGLPVLEAMACGAPVITGNGSSLPAVAGDAAILVDPLSVDDIATALEQVLGHPTLGDGMRQRGLARASSFSWLATAQATTSIYRRVANGRKAS